MEKLLVSHSPHINHGDTTRGIMLDVIIALLPATVAGCVIFGLYSALVVLTCVVTAVLAEFVSRKVMKRPSNIGDLSAVVTGLLLALNLPPKLPLWMAAIGSIAAIVVVKQMFGGIGHNFANPAITARLVLLVSFPTAMTTWVAPLGSSGEVTSSATTGEVIDVLTSATPLSNTALEGGYYSYTQLFFGQIPGCIGETCALLLLAGGIYLVVRRVITPTTPLCFIGTVALCYLIAGEDPLYMILSGGLMLGAIYMATDYVTSPTNWRGQIIFGVGCGLITFVIRYFGYLPEGVSYAILLMNILTPYINRLTAPKPFGWEGKK
ncbi:MAG: RnfABCDGE type electron transport complex subunit D [Ruminococcaceae bacterium]|nr:RnfABCDGE type electron transport complex subunit D [Oscillospiraceae bacterium]